MGRKPWDRIRLTGHPRSFFNRIEPLTRQAFRGVPHHAAHMLRTGYFSQEEYAGPFSGPNNRPGGPRAIR